MKKRKSRLFYSQEKKKDEGKVRKYKITRLKSVVGINVHTPLVEVLNWGWDLDVLSKYVVKRRENPEKIENPPLNHR